MSFETWVEVRPLLSDRVGEMTERQRELACLLQVTISEDAPMGVSAANLRAAIATDDHR